MKTITFYSYKGGVGRSLALVNIATRLAEFGKKVCVLDFDLEAPGLHLKLQVPPYKQNAIKQGIVDYVYDFTNNGIVRNNIKDYCVDINIIKNAKSISLIPAGDTSSSNYWKKLASINWYNLIYENPNGLAFFLNLKENIKKNINPDFLLIDSRTGISEMSGITLSLLADDVVLLAANNKENLSGISKIIKSIVDPENNILGHTPNITFVLSRIPFTEKSEDRAKELHLINRIKRQYLNSYINDDIYIIHSDRELEEDEKVKIAYEKDESNTQISIDYLKLFEKLTKNDLSENEIRRFNNIRKSERLIIQANSTNNPNLKLELISNAIDLNKGNIDLYLHRANVYYDLKNYEEALLDIKHILSLNDSTKNAITLLINILIAQGKFPEAKKETNRLLDIYPDDPMALLFKATICTYIHEYNEGEEACNKIIEMYPDLSIGYSTRGNIRRVKEDYANALTDIYKAIELDSENLYAIATLGEIYAETGKINDFYIHFENALKIDILNKNKAMNKVIEEESIYKKFYNDDRFRNLLSKYSIYIKNIDNPL